MTNKVGLYRCKCGKKTKWRVRWFGEYMPASGRQKRYSRTFDRKVDAETFQVKKAEELRSGSPRDPSTKTLKDYCQWWLQNRTKSQGLRVATIDSYRNTIRRLTDYFGDEILLRHITPEAAEMFLGEQGPLKGDKPLSNWTRHQILRGCKTLFKDAEDLRFISRSPFRERKAPKTSITPWYYLPPTEYAKLLDATPSTREKALYALYYTAGLRLTEAVALRWVDIDFETGELHVVRYAGTETLPPFDIKDNEIRTIQLPQQTIDLLLRLQAEAPEKVPYALLTEARYRRVTAKWQKYRAEEQPWHNRDYANNVLTRFRERIKRAGIKPGGKSLTIHTLRKCCCQNWIQAGLPMNMVQKLMGHADIGTTAKHYSQVTPEQKRQVKDALTARLRTPSAGANDHKLTFSPDFACNGANGKQ